MTHDDLLTILNSTDLPVAYSHFSKSQSAPFVVFLRTNSDNVYADDSIVNQFNNYRIELYTDKKEAKTEKLVEDALLENGINYTIDESYIESEKRFLIVYEIQI